MFFAGVRERTSSIGDRSVLFEGLIRDSYKQAYGLAYRLTGNSAEAETGGLGASSLNPASGRPAPNRAVRRRARPAVRLRDG